ncbi:hypothetical protein FNV43_RR15393 [Rhamnella rubrinervis]|uniref:Protein DETOXIFICATION n=1 Tax=Rhamnella rubrinervis TaxID=2594499 RepID=A0A8K0E8Q7_9ROSA|nr:hypothetical protein FNV43_RR15393 [Rhamnella rubrinervis]
MERERDIYEKLVRESERHSYDHHQAGDYEYVEDDDEYNGVSLVDAARIEGRRLWKVALPAMSARLAGLGITIITLAFIGQAGPVTLAAYSLVHSVIMKIANGILLGMSSSLQTLCGQAYGARQYDMLGIYLQRSWIILFIGSICLLPLFIFPTPILKFLGQDEYISELAGYMGLWFIPVLFAHSMMFSCQKFLLTHDKKKIVKYFALASIVFHLGVTWELTVNYNFGATAVLASSVIAYWIPGLGQFLYITCGGCKETWKGFSSLAFKDLWPVVKYSVSSGIIYCLELWYTTILILLTGNLKNAEVSISALSVCLNINGWVMMLALGFMAAVSIRVANELGRGRTKAAKLSVGVAVLISFGIGFVLFIICLFAGGRFAPIFTDSYEVANAIADLSPLLAISLLLNSVQPVLSGVALGIGRQGTIAFVNLACYYITGIPLGLVFGYTFNMRVQGMWIGMLIGTFVQTIALAVFTWKIDWDREVVLARNRGSIWKESKKILVVAGPIFTRFSAFGMNVITLAFIGHIGSTELAGFSLVMTVLVSWAKLHCKFFVVNHMVQDNTILGIHLQRSLTALFFSSISCLIPLFIFTAPILKLLGQEEKISEMAGYVSLWLISVIFAYGVSFSCQSLCSLYVEDAAKHGKVSHVLLAFKDLRLVVKLSVSFGVMLLGGTGIPCYRAGIPIP